MDIGVKHAEAVLINGDDLHDGRGKITLEKDRRNENEIWNCRRRTDRVKYCEKIS